MSLQIFGLGWIALAGLAIPAFAALPARPGTLNFIEGKVSVDGREVTSNSIGAADVPAGSILTTESGKAELLLTPGVFLRLGSNSEIRMVSSGLMDTRIAVNRGVALLEATQVHKENNLHIATSGLNAAIKDEGLYRFDSGRSAISVFNGKAEVRQGDDTEDVKKGKEVVASNAPLKVEKFDTSEAKKADELYQWSDLRSKYLAESSAATARRVFVQPGLWAGSGWYWNPWLRMYSWLPASSSAFSPFGYGYYSPWSYYYQPMYRPIYVVPRSRVGPGMRGRMGPGLGSGRVGPGLGSGRVGPGMQSRQSGVGMGRGGRR